jgi:co-chaperonin GroES (HSP10)
MNIEINEKDLQKLIVIGDRVLIKPRKEPKTTNHGLYLPPGVHKREEVYTGYVLKVGPGYPIPAIQDTDESWKEQRDEVKYVPLQPKEGDLAVYLQKNAIEIVFNNEKYVIVSQSAMLLIMRDED